MLEDKIYKYYWVSVKPQMIEGMTKGYEVRFDDFEDAKYRYDQFVDEYDGVELFEEKRVVYYQVLESNNE